MVRGTTMVHIIEAHVLGVTIPQSKIIYFLDVLIINIKEYLLKSEIYSNKFVEILEQILNF